MSTSGEATNSATSVKARGMPQAAAAACALARRVLATPTTSKSSGRARGAAAYRDVLEEGRERGGDRLVVGHADAADGAARAGDADGGRHGLVGADALEDRVRAEAAGQLHHARHGLVAALAHHVGPAELLRQRDPVRVPAHDGDLPRAE